MNNRTKMKTRPPFHVPYVSFVCSKSYTYSVIRKKVMSQDPNPEISLRKNDS